jgi:trans-2,3-dihydro-3-hydroxyanthranilate isomerase
MAYRYVQYDVFTREPLTGNQLAVYLDARGLDSARMQSIAREMNFSETTFVLPSEQAGTDIRMRIFTPGNEMPIAGHPTIGTTFALADAGIIRHGSSRFVFGLNAGPTPVDLQWDGSRLEFAWMTQGLPQFGADIADRAAAAAALTLQASDLADGLPVQVVSCGVPFVFIPLRDKATVDRASADAAMIRRVGGKYAVFLFAVSPAGSEETVYSRMFAPDFGIVEDPATGIASGALGSYLVRHAVVSGDATRRILSLQGAAMRRPSRIHIDIEGAADNISRVRVGGESVLVAEGSLLI